MKTKDNDINNIIDVYGQVSELYYQLEEHEEPTYKNTFESFVNCIIFECLSRK